MNAFGSEFGLAVVNAGQRQVNDKAELVVNSTKGGFTLSGAGSSLLGIADGGYIQFVSNYEAIAAEIKKGTNETLKAFCDEHGLVLGSEEATVAIHKEFDMFALIKGIKLLDKVGNPVMVSERLTMEDRKAYAKTHLAEMLESAMSSENEELKEALGRENITEDEQIEILAQYVTLETEKYSGSKCASSSKATGAGVPLKFSDGNVWSQMKRDLAEDERTAINRRFSIDVAQAMDIQVSNGYQDLTVTAYPLTFVADETPMQRGNK